MQRTLVIYFVIFLSFTWFSAFSQIGSPVKKDVPLKNDSSTVALRNFDLQKIKDYSLQKEFHYDDQTPAGTSLWDRFWSWFWDLFSATLENKYSGTLIKYLVIVVVPVLVIFAVIKLIGLDLNIFTGKSKAVEVPYDESLENIHEINFNEEIEKAVTSGNYRLAVRLLYLRSLKLLSDRALINWQPDKTNQAYVEELIDLERKHQFRVLTLQFEYIWYGDFPIDSTHFKGLKSSFERFNVKAL